MLSRAARVLWIAAVFFAVCAFGAQLLMEVDAQREDVAGANIGLGILMLFVMPMPWIVGSAAFVVSAEDFARTAGGALGGALRLSSWLGIALAVAAFAAMLVFTSADLAVTYAEAQAHSPISATLSFLSMGCVLLSLVLMAIIALGPARHPDTAILFREDYESLSETAYLTRSPANARRLQDAVDRLGAGEGHEHAPHREGRR